MDEQELMRREWDLAWEHIKTSKTIYWGLFASLIVINGSAIGYLAQANKGLLITDIMWGVPVFSVALLFLLLINILMTFVYQREHFAQKENYQQLHNIREEILNKTEKRVGWNYFPKNVFMPGIGYLYFQFIKLLICSIPVLLALYITKNILSGTCVVLLFILAMSICCFICKENLFHLHCERHKREGIKVVANQCQKP